MPVVAVALAVAACGDEGSGPPAQVPAKLDFQVQPSATTAGQTILPAIAVAVEDAGGNVVTAADNSVTLAIGANPSAATLSGTTSVNATAGVATFADLQVNRSGSGFTLVATAASLTAANSVAFDVSPVHGVAADIAPLAGDVQTATVGQVVAIDPAVTVTDGFGDPVAGVPVTFSVTYGGGIAAGLDQTTNALGVATVGEWTLGTVAGGNTLSATSPDLHGSPVRFNATATAGAPAALERLSVETQIAEAGTPVTGPPSVAATDSYGNPVADVEVTFGVTAGGGSVEGATQTTVASGVAAVESWTLGNSPGPNTVEATAPGLAGSPVTFHATGTTPGVPTTATVQVHSNYFLSERNGSGANPGLFGSEAVDTIPVGGTVIWHWIGGGHNVTPYENTGFIASGTHGTNFTYGPITFSAAGTYRYRCTIHSSEVPSLGLVGMRGRIVVR
jgi:adhesin/invasin